MIKSFVSNQDFFVSRSDRENVQRKGAANTSDHAHRLAVAV